MDRAICLDYNRQVQSASVWAHFAHVPVCWLCTDWSPIMRPTFRKPVDKRSSAKRFRRDSARTKGANMAAPMRGGIRL